MSRRFRSVSLLGSGFLAFALISVASGRASAQDASVNGSASVNTNAPRLGGGGPNLAGTDRAAFIGHVAVGWYGVHTLWAGVDNANGDNPIAFQVPVVGVRYWFNNQIGIDGGLGFRVQSGSTENRNGKFDRPSTTGVLLHAGLPIALADARHISMQITPEANIGFASGKTGGDDVSGFLLNLGARAGAEVFFGFMGIPQLSLEGSVGLFFETRSTKRTTPGNPSVSLSQVDLSTSQLNDPWDFFKGNVAARYYF